MRRVMWTCAVLTARNPAWVQAMTSHLTSSPYAPVCVHLCRAEPPEHKNGECEARIVARRTPNNGRLRKQLRAQPQICESLRQRSATILRDARAATTRVDMSIGPAATMAAIALAMRLAAPNVAGMFDAISQVCCCGCCNCRFCPRRSGASLPPRLFKLMHVECGSPPTQASQTTRCPDLHSEWISEGPATHVECNADNDNKCGRVHKVSVLHGLWSYIGSARSPRRVR